MAFPIRDSLLVPYSANFDARITASASTFALTTLQASQFAGLNTTYQAAVVALQAAVASGTRSKSLYAARDAARESLLQYGRQLYSIVQASLNVSDANKELLGVLVKKTTITPVPVPSIAPSIDILERVGTTVRIRVHDGSGTRRGRPVGVQGSSLFSFVGSQPPAQVSDWTFQGNRSITTIAVQFDASLAPGTVVWLTAFFYNPRGESGPGCAPVSAILAGGGMQQAA